MISIIMLTYNREQLVSRAIESVLIQTYRDFEYIIVDNGSSDRSGRIADGYAEKDARIRVIHRKRGNIGLGRNEGLDAARGDYITFIDDDDWLEPNFLKFLWDLAEERSADISICGSWRETAGVRKPKYVFDGTYDYTGEEAVMEMLKREKLNAGTPTKLISRHLFDGLRYDSLAKYDDIRMTYKLLARAKKVVVSGRPLYICTRHDHNNSAGTTQGEAVQASQVEEYLTAFRERTIWLTERFPDKADFWLYAELSYVLSMYDKVTDRELRVRLAALLERSSEAFSRVERFYTMRDKMLIKEYGG